MDYVVYYYELFVNGRFFWVVVLVVNQDSYMMVLMQKYEGLFLKNNKYCVI